MNEVAQSVPLGTIVGWIAFYFVGLSAIGYYMMYDDKARARTYQRRISEASLLFMSFIGGAFGVKIAQRKFRHKTRKEPFRTSLNKTAVWNFIIIGLLTYVLSSHTVFVEEALGAFLQDGAAERSVRIKINHGLD